MLERKVARWEKGKIDLSLPLDAMKVSNLEEISYQDIDSDVIEWGKVLYIAKVFSILLLMENNDKIISIKRIKVKRF